MKHILPTGPITINNLSDWKKFLSYITEDNFKEILDCTTTTGSNYQTVGIIYFQLCVYVLDEKMGANIPKKINDKAAIFSLPNIEDNMCFFHALAVYEKYQTHCKKLQLAKEQNKRLPRFDTRDTAKAAKTYFKMKFDKIEGFPGVSFRDISDYEDLIEKNIEVFECNENLDDQKKILISEEKYAETITLAKLKDHLMLVKDKNQFMGKFLCKFCGTYYAHSQTLQTHRKKFGGECALKPIRQQDVFKSETTPWAPDGNPLEKFFRSIDYPYKKEDLVLDGLLTWDFETSTNESNRRLKNTTKKKPEKLSFHGQQEPMSWSVCYILPGEKEPTTKTVLIDECDYCPYKLVEAFVDYVVKISKKNFRYYNEKFPKIFKEVDYEDSKKLSDYITQTALPCIGFNSGKFDLQVLTSYGLYHKILNHEGWKLCDENPEDYVEKPGETYE